MDVSMLKKGPQQDEGNIVIDGFTFAVSDLSTEQKQHVQDINRTEATMDQKKFEIHICEHYRQTLIDELGNMLKADGKT